MDPEALVGNCVEEISKAREEKNCYIYEPHAGLGKGRQAVKTAGTLYGKSESSIGRDVVPKYTVYPRISWRMSG